MTRDIFHKITFHVKGDQGVAFITVLVVSTVLSLSAAAYFAQSSQEAGVVTTRIDSTQAFYAAESAIEWAKYQLKAFDWWDLDGWSEEIPVPGEGETAAATQVDFTYDGIKGTITSTGNLGAKQRRVIVEVAPDMSMLDRPIFNKAACACDQLTIANGSTDSYISSLGAYGGANVSNSGDVGSNGDIALEGNTLIDGNADAMGSLSGGQNNEITGDATLGVDAANYQGDTGGTLTEYHDFVANVCPCDLFDLEAGIAEAQADNDNDQVEPQYLWGTDFSIAGQNTTTLTTGTYYFTQFQSAGQAKVFIEGEVVIYLSTDAAVNISGNSLINFSDNAANLRIYTDTTDVVDISGNGDFSGAIYAPYSEQMTVSGNGEIFGSIVGNNVQLSGNGGIHYDETAAGKSDLPFGPGAEVGVDVISWQEAEI